MNANELNGIEVCNDKQIAEMDVNHLVEYLNGWYSTAAPRKAATMLRQQQKQIETLKKENEELSALCVEFNVLRKAQEK